MAQRTLASKYEAHDAVHSIQRQVLTWTKDSKEICYEVEAAEPLAEELAQPAELPEYSLPVAEKPSRPVKAAVIQDAPLSSTDIMRAIIAQKLKRSSSDIVLRHSIKDLAGGNPRLSSDC